MLRAGKLTRLAAGLACLIVAFTLLAPGVATAGTPGGGSAGFAGMVVHPKTFTSTYSCDLSNYGSGLMPVTISGTLTFPGTAPALSPLGIALSTTSSALPSSVLSQLNGVTSVSLTTAVAAQNATASSVTLSGQARVSGPLTGLPVNEATGQVTFAQQGTGVIEVPAKTLTFTPHTSAGALKPITCTATAATQDVPVTVTIPVFGTTGPLYKCVEAIGRASVTLLLHAPMTITSSGARTTGKTDTVTLASDAFWPYPPDTTSVGFSGDLPVRGTQPGKIALSKTTTDVTSKTFRVSGKLPLTKPGNYRILVPEKFTFTWKITVTSLQAVITVTLTCAINTSPTPVGLTFKVAKRHVHPHPTGSSTPTSTATGGGGQGEGGGTPVGAPATGGGSGPAGGLGTAVAGLAILLSGGGLVFLARRRHRHGRSAA